VAVAVITIALAGAGCGDSEDKGSGGLGKEKLVARADPICKRHFEKISAGSRSLLAGGQVPNPRAFGKFALGTIVPETKAQTSELRALKPAADVAPAYRKWLADLDATVAKVGKNPAVVTNGANFRAVNGEADKLGLSKQCHFGPG